MEGVAEMTCIGPQAHRGINDGPSFTCTSCVKNIRCRDCCPKCTNKYLVSWKFNPKNHQVVVEADSPTEAKTKALKEIMPGNINIVYPDLRARKLTHEELIKLQEQQVNDA